MIPQARTYRGKSYKIFDDYNKFHLFVEDSGFENLYLAILQNFGMDLCKVFSKNGKDSVVAQANACTDSKCIYLIDKDWADFSGDLHEGANLITLDRYCIENYLVEFDAFKQLIVSEKPKIKANEGLSQQEHENIVNYIFETLRPLFEEFLAVQNFDVNHPNVGQPPGKFAEKNQDRMPDPNLIQDYINSSPTEPCQSVRNYFTENDPLASSPGKYLLLFIWNSIKKSFGLKQIQEDRLTIRLAQLSRSEALQNLCESLDQLAQSRKNVAS